MWRRSGRGKGGRGNPLSSKWRLQSIVRAPKIIMETRELGEVKKEEKERESVKIARESNKSPFLRGRPFIVRRVFLQLPSLLLLLSAKEKVMMMFTLGILLWTFISWHISVNAPGLTVEGTHIYFLDDVIQRGGKSFGWRRFRASLRFCVGL